MYQLDANNFTMILWTCKCQKHVEAIYEIKS